VDKQCNVCPTLLTNNLYDSSQIIATWRSYPTLLFWCRYLRVIDRFNNYVISAYITPGGMRFLLLHDGHKEDSVRNYFVECHELYTKNMMNPFADFDAPIVSRAFDNQVKSISKRVLGV
jgi:hypothetical protein